MKATKETQLKGPRGSITIIREPHGSPHIYAKYWIDAYFALGWLHACDRFVAIHLLSTISQGRLSETIASKKEFLELDLVFRKMNFWGKTLADFQMNHEQYPETISFLEAYSSGVNRYRDNHMKPVEFIVTGFKPSRWTPIHSLALGSFMGYAGLAQGQEDIERFIIDALQKNVDPPRLEEFFYPHLNGYEPDLIKQVKHFSPHPLTLTTPSHIIPLIGGSNNWAIAPKRSGSGTALLANDPHLEINRLPPVWYEVSMTVDSTSLVGVTFPGIPGCIIGRNNTLGFGVTYTMADTIDFWIQDCKGGRYLLDGDYNDFLVREEVFKRRFKKPLKHRFYELHDGAILDGEPLHNGFYLSMKWAGFESGALQTLDNVLKMNQAHTVKEGSNLVAKTAFPALNWVFADSDGSIAHHVGGGYPRRIKDWSGLYPLPGWKSENLWQGLLDPHELPSVLNPKSGIIATANNNVNQKGKPLIVNAPLPSYRVDRIEKLCAEPATVSIDDMKRIQKDCFSEQVRLFMEKIIPYLDDSINATYLREWDYTYQTHSYAPSVFENVYRELILTVFGNGGFGRPWLQDLIENTPLKETLVYFFDRTLLENENSVWYEDADRNLLWKESIRKGLKKKAVRWGEVNNITMENIFFGGKLPTSLGFDAGPFPLPGGRATIFQGNIFSFWGRKTSFAPSYRFVTDMAENFIETALPGGESGRRFSPFYKNRILSFFQGHYDRIDL